MIGQKLDERIYRARVKFSPEYPSAFNPQPVSLWQFAILEGELKGVVLCLPHTAGLMERTVLGMIFCQDMTDVVKIRVGNDPREPDVWKVFAVFDPEQTVPCCHCQGWHRSVDCPDVGLE